LLHPVSHEQVVSSLQESIERVRDTRYRMQRRTFFVRAYDRHLDHVRRTATKLDVPLIEVMVDHNDDDDDDDDDDTKKKQHPGILLTKALLEHGVKLPNDNDLGVSSCWTWEASRIDDDWRNFSFPF